VGDRGKPVSQRSSETAPAQPAGAVALPEQRWGVAFLTELLDSEGSVLLDDEDAAALRDRLDDLACETENGGLVRRAVADDERATAVGERLEDARRPGSTTTPCGTVSPRPARKHASV